MHDCDLASSDDASVIYVLTSKREILKEQKIRVCFHPAHDDDDVIVC